MAAKYRTGYATMVDHVGPEAGITAGQFVLIGAGGAFGIAHTDIAPYQQGAIAVANGSTIYEVDKDDVSDSIAIGTVVELKLANHTAVPAGDAEGAFAIGRAVSQGTSGATKVMVQMIPAITNPAA